MDPEDIWTCATIGNFFCEITALQTNQPAGIRQGIGLVEVIFRGRSSGLDQAQRSFNGATALEIAISNFLLRISSARICSVLIFFSR